MSSEAKGLWKKVTPLLADLGILSKTDVNIITRYCVLFSRWRKAEEFIEKNGTTYETQNKNGSTYFAPYPEVRIAAQLAALLQRIESELGLTPSARTQLKVAPRPDSADDKKRRFLKLT